MINVLGELCVETEASTLMAMKMAELYINANVLQLTVNNNWSPIISISQSLLKKQAIYFLSVIAKYYCTKRLPNFTYECMEV